MKKPARSSDRANLEFYLSSPWKAIKRAFWAEPLNQYCHGIKGDGSKCMKPRGKWFQVDHIKPLPHGITFGDFLALSELSMLQPLCGGCHARKTLKERRAK